MSPVRTYPDGSTIEAEGGGYVYVCADEDRNMSRVFYESNSDADHLLEAELWAELDQRTARDLAADVQIPLSVAVLGRAAIAAWLSVAVERTVPRIAADLDVSEATVRQYLSNFRSGR